MSPRRLWRSGMAIALATTWIARAEAQTAAVDPRCSASDPTLLATQDACQKGIDLFRFMAPQLGVAVVGGNPVLGQVGALGGLGDFSVGVRAMN